VRNGGRAGGREGWSGGNVCSSHPSLPPSLPRMLHSEFAHGTADDSIYHACELIVKGKLRYLPIINPEQQLMLSVLSQLDILGKSTPPSLPPSLPPYLWCLCVRVCVSESRGSGTTPLSLIQNNNLCFRSFLSYPR